MFKMPSILESLMAEILLQKAIAQATSSSQWMTGTNQWQDSHHHIPVVQKCLLTLLQDNLLIIMIILPHFNLLQTYAINQQQPKHTQTTLETETLEKDIFLTIVKGLHMSHSFLCLPMFQVHQMFAPHLLWGIS